MASSSTTPSSTLPAKADAVIIGGGVIGVATALELARRGVSVAVLERDRIGHGCSYGNAGWLTPSLAVPLPAPGLIWKSFRWLFDPESPLYIQPRFDPGLARWLVGFLAATTRSRFERGAAALVELCRASVDDWEQLATTGGEDFGFERKGLVSVYETDGAFETARAAVELVARHGVRFETWTAAQVREREPAVVGPQIGALFFPDDAHCEPYPAVRALMAAATKAGARFFEGTEVFGFRRNGRSISALSTTRGEIAAHQVVLATGAWSEAMGRELDLRIPILGAKGYSLLLPRLEHQPQRSIYLAERKVAVNPHRDTLRIAGTLELVREDLSINRRRVAAILRGAHALLDIPKGSQPTRLWRGLRPCTPDGMPMIGRARGHENLWISTGHQMTGLKTAPGSGRLLAELMTGTATTFDPQPFRASRY